MLRFMYTKSEKFEAKNCNLNQFLYCTRNITATFNLLMGFTGGIDNAAHIGGLLSGFIIGLAMSRQLKQQIEIFN